ncbi:flagellar motor protein MotB [Polaribacter sp. HL-MS24]|uniref:OmpA/MotB family protein n=1 Tax=Polaribacter sp. HL-MS24 TaxID=3077735 RepID=UPI0029347383|nr:OmpA family protein [Polaribacter sp. HL-MS24]WOC39763.1 OmpA family protein [Polaribacter sp. HL-MS24]
MNKLVVPVVLVLLTLTSCVSKKNYVALEQKFNDTRGTLQKTTVEKESLEAKFAKIEERVANYYDKINSLKSDNVTLQNANHIKYNLIGNTAVLSTKTRAQLKATLTKVDPSLVLGAKTLKDSLNIAMSYNLKKSFDNSDINATDDIDININQTVVMISISDKLLFNTASYQVKKGAYALLKNIANVIQSEPSMEVMIEGHTDSRTIRNTVVQDNWDLSVKRATSIVRLLEGKYGVDGSRLIASGRGATVPLVPNTSAKNRARNRRTRIVILPNLDKFFALLADNNAK